MQFAASPESGKTKRSTNTLITMSENPILPGFARPFMKCWLMLGLLSWLAHGVGMATGSGASLRFLAERTPDHLGEVNLVAGAIQTPAFALFTDHLSESVTAPARTMLLRLKDKPVTLAELALPPAGESFIVLLIPNPRGGYLPVVMPAHDPTFRGGDVYFYNHAPKPVFGHVGSSLFRLKPGEGVRLRPAGAHEDTFYDVGFAVSEDHGDRVLRSIRWPVVTRSRSYVFFYHDPLRNRIDYRAVDEFISSPSGQAVP